MIRWAGILWVVLLSGGCLERTAESCALGPCISAARPYCDVEGKLGGLRNECIAVTCTPGEFGLCRDDQAITCSAGGDNYDLVACEFGCDDAIQGCRECAPGTSRCDGDTLHACDGEGRATTPESCALGCLDGELARCRHVVPRYVPDACDIIAGDSLMIASSATFDSDLDNNCTGGIVPQAGAPSICVVRHGTITIAESAMLKVRGKRVIALVADHALTISGTFDVGADRSISGPGGGVIASGGPETPMQGGGGAGFRTAGGPGGTATADGGAANGGAAMPDPALLAALIGGPRSGATTDFFGGGGGAATLVSCRGTVSVTGTITAGGGAGRGGNEGLLGILFHGSGGGAGGYVVLQGAAVRVTGAVFANGGGGGSGKPIGATEGATGQNGGPSDVFGSAGGSAPIGSGAGNGGGGWKAGQGPFGGVRSTAAGATSGGGGGGAGFFQTYTPAAITPELAPVIASPPFQPPGTIATR